MLLFNFIEKWAILNRKLIFQYHSVQISFLLLVNGKHWKYTKHTTIAKHTLNGFLLLHRDEYIN